MGEMEVKPLCEDTLIAEACCGSGYLLLKRGSELSEQERTILRAAEIKAEWLKEMTPKGLSARIAYEEKGAVGFIEYMPIELSSLYEGKDLYVVNCMMAPHKPPFSDPLQVERIPGCGSALVRAMLEDVESKCKGIVTPPGFAYTGDMRGFFAKFGFEGFENEGLKMLIKRFESVALPSPVCLEEKYEFVPVEGKVVVDVFWSSICPIMGPFTLFNIKQACEEFGDKVIVNDVCIDEREVLERYGITQWGKVFLNGKPAGFWGPPDKEEILKALKKALDAG
jgi:hypothetical protein